MSDSLQPRGLQHTRPPCLSPTLGVYSNSCPLSWWCHPTISSSVVSSSCLQSFPASESFPMSYFFASCGQSIGVSASAAVLPMNIQGWFLLGLTGLISLGSKGLLSLLQYYSSKASILWCSAFFMVQLSHLCMTTGKTIALTRWTIVSKVMSLLFNMLSRFVIAFLPSKITPPTPIPPKKPKTPIPKTSPLTVCRPDVWSQCLRAEIRVQAEAMLPLKGRILLASSWWSPWWLLVILDLWPHHSSLQGQHLQVSPLLPSCRSTCDCI